MKNLIFILLITTVTINTQLIAMDENPIGNPSAIIFREQFQHYCIDYANTKGLSQNYELLVLDLDKATQDKLHPFNTSYAQEIAKLDVYSLARLLYKAAEQGNIFEACLIVNTNQSVITLTQDFTHSPLQSAIKYKQRDMIHYLIKVGASVDYYYPKTGTALYIAACTNNVEAAKILIKSGADPNRQHFSRTTLFPAAEKGHLEMVNYLLSLRSKINLGKLKDKKARPKIDVNAQDGIKCTSLYYAARYGHLNIVQALITAGADVAIKGIYGTPLDAAIEKKHKEIVVYLQKYYKDLMVRHIAYTTIHR